jgi:hypothetical protein
MRVTLDDGLKFSCHLETLNMYSYMGKFKFDHSGLHLQVNHNDKTMMELFMCRSMFSVWSLSSVQEDENEMVFFVNIKALWKEVGKMGLHKQLKYEWSAQDLCSLVVTIETRDYKPSYMNGLCLSTSAIPPKALLNWNNDKINMDDEEPIKIEEDKKKEEEQKRPPKKKGDKRKYEDDMVFHPPPTTTKNVKQSKDRKVINLQSMISKPKVRTCVDDDDDEKETVERMWTYQNLPNPMRPLFLSPILLSPPLDDDGDIWCRNKTSCTGDSRRSRVCGYQVTMGASELCSIFREYSIMDRRNMMKIVQEEEEIKNGKKKLKLVWLVKGELGTIETSKLSEGDDRSFYRSSAVHGIGSTSTNKNKIKKKDKEKRLLDKEKEDKNHGKIFIQDLSLQYVAPPPLDVTTTNLSMKSKVTTLVDNGYSSRLIKFFGKCLQNGEYVSLYLCQDRPLIMTVTPKDTMGVTLTTHIVPMYV